MSAPARSEIRPWWRSRAAEDVALVAIAVLVAIVVRAFVAQAYYIPSASMVPQLRIDDRVVVSRLSYDLHAVHRGDIVVFKAPPALNTEHGNGGAVRSVLVALGLAEDHTVLIKRVIALAGETVSGRGGHVYVNDEMVVEPYLPTGTYTSTFGPFTVPPGDVWVMGDNRGNSEDSRFFGPIPQRTIVGRATWKVWPPWKASFL
ncbi:MAG TPA: signal peptidase I [Acidimicrobiales bacterium]|nr:signal peptidase I [Acidimicrobiales bacterium]